MNIRFIDTSIMLNLLEVPNACAAKESVKAEWKHVLEVKDMLIMPASTIIETGNHIAHIPDGNIRRRIALQFKQYLIKTANSEAPWILYGTMLDKEELLYLAENIEEYATQKIGIGDMSIIHAFETYKDEQPAIGTIMIWSTDEHLSAYRVDNVSLHRRRK